MSKENLGMPTASVIPTLAYDDVTAAAAWLCTALGFAERLRIGGHRVQLVHGNGAFVVTQRAPDARHGAPAGSAPDHTVMLRVADAHAHHAQAVAAGAQVLGPPVDYPYGERQYNAVDLGGHHWTFSQSIADVDPATWGGQLFIPES